MPKLIGEEDDSESLQNYSNKIMNIFVNNQLVCFPNGQRMIDAFLSKLEIYLYIIIINNNITISEIPAVQILALLLEHDEFLRNLKKN